VREERGKEDTGGNRRMRREEGGNRRNEDEGGTHRDQSRESFMLFFVANFSPFT
jgi:hypothetical protein